MKDDIIEQIMATLHVEKRIENVLKLKMLRECVMLACLKFSKY
jgi:hypothetical protein